MAIYTTGLIAVGTGKTASGTGTAWNAQNSGIRPGQTILVNTNPPQQFQIVSINSATSMTVSPAPPANISATKYAILISDALSVDGLASQVSEAILYFKSNLDGKASSGDNNDITSLSGLKTPLSLNQGGIGSNSAEGGRRTLELGSAATADVQTSPEDVTDERVLRIGAFGLGVAAAPVAQDFTNRQFSGTYRVGSAGSSLPESGANYICQSWNYDSNNKVVMGYRLGGGISFYARGFVGGKWLSPICFYTTGNTTVDTNNFIKKASPIARLADSPGSMQSDFVVNGQQTLSGLVSVNEEAEGVSAEKVSKGVYRVMGAAGLATEGWTIEIPQDINGNRLCFVELSTDEDGVINVYVTKRKFDGESGIFKAGEPMDIPEGRWIDLRLNMPHDSIWNIRKREADDFDN